MAHYGCPYCASEMLSELREASALVDVYDWADDGTPSERAPRGVLLSVYASESSEYFCRTCKRTFRKPVALESPTDSGLSA